jgi:hypothetical protein
MRVELVLDSEYLSRNIACLIYLVLERLASIK